MAERAILVLGAGGFIGRALVERLAARGERVVAAVRTTASFSPGVTLRATGTLAAATPWPGLLEGVGAVVHLASRAHAPPAAGEAWIETEVAAAAALGQAARDAGIARILLVSSIKVYGDPAGRIRAGDPPQPNDPYGRAKLRLEQALAALGVPLTVLRPPLVYGPEVKGNFRALLQLVERGLPLPLASVANRRSFIGLDNLLDLIEAALGDQRALGQTFLMRDDREVSTPDLIRLIAQGLGRPARLLPCPPAVLAALAGLAGRGADARRLLGSLTLDDGATRERLGWRPRIALEDGIAAACRAFRDAA